jgi:hypothetical protein
MKTELISKELKSERGKAKDISKKHKEELDKLTSAHEKESKEFRE